MDATKRKAAIEYLLARLGEPSTWSGIGFVVALSTGKGIGLDWDLAASLGGMVSALIKIMLPDSLK